MTSISPFQQARLAERERLMDQLNSLELRRKRETRSLFTGKAELDSDALERIDALKSQTFKALAQINRDSMNRLDDEEITAKEELSHMLTVSPPETDLWDMNLTLLDDPRSCVDMILGRGDKPTAVWALSTAERTSTQWQVYSDHEPRFSRKFSSKRLAVEYANRSYAPLRIRAIETTRDAHNGVHWDTCPDDCDVAHGWIEIGAHPVSDFDQVDRETRTYAIDRIEANEDLEHLDAL